MSSLPISNISKNAASKSTKVFFNEYYTTPINISDNELTSAISFFESKGFDNSAALTTSIILINQAKNDKVNIFTLIDSLRSLSNVKLTELVAEILNYNRRPSSVIGFKRNTSVNRFESRNIIENAVAEVVINTSTENNFSATGFSFDSETLTWDGD